MPTIILLLVVLGGGYLLFKEPTKPKTQSGEAPADAQGLFAALIAPSMTDTNALQQGYTAMKAAGDNLEETSVPAAERVAQYALCFFLKACMLAKGAQPDPNELAAIGNAPFSGGLGLVSYGDVELDKMNAVAAALAPTYTDAAGIGQYISSLMQVGSATNTTTSSSARIVAYMLALKAKQMSLQNPVGFTDAQKLPGQCFFAIANLAAANVPKTGANSILTYNA